MRGGSVSAAALVGLLLASAGPAAAGGRRERPPVRLRDWMVRHQSPDGGWRPDGYRDRCEGDGCPGAATGRSAVGTTGLVLLAFAGYGETHRTARYGPVIRRGFLFLKGVQDAEGCYGARDGDRYLRDHAIASCALLELYDATRSPYLVKDARAALGFLLSRRGRDGGWSADAGTRSDAVTTAWALAALRTARAAGLEVADDAFRDAVACLDAVPDAEAATAAALWARSLCGRDATESPAFARGIEVLLRSLPTRKEGDDRIDPESWFMGARVCFSAGGAAWSRWNEALKHAVIDVQVYERESCRYGSWDPVPGPSAEMGRVATTALCVLTLEVYYRYAVVFGRR